jgi:hypothetical protein
MVVHANPTFPPSSRPLIAPAWHTIVFIAIFLGLSIAGGFFQHAVKQHPQPTVQGTSPVPGYVSVLISEWLLVLYVRMGVHKCGVRLRDLVGGRWATPVDVLKDFALGAALWALWRNECRAGASSPWASGESRVDPSRPFRWIL